MDDEYRRKIEACENCDKLTEWERNFIGSVRTRTNLSMGQKRVVENIFATRIEGKEVKRNTRIELQHGIVDAVKDDAGWIVTVAGHRVGFGLTRKEAGIINPWLAEALKDIFEISATEAGLANKKKARPAAEKSPDETTGANPPENTEEEPF